MTDAHIAETAETGIDAGYWDGLADGELRLPRCTACGTWIWPALPRCTACPSTAVEWEAVEAAGTVYSWTRTWYPFVAERAEDLPYVVVLVELPDAGRARLLGMYAGSADDELTIGEPVTGIIAPPSSRTFGLPSLTWVRS